MPTTTITETGTAVASLQARTNSAGAAVLDVNGEELRLYASLFSEGVVDTDHYSVTPGAGMSVLVGSGDAKTDLAVVTGTLNGQGKYLVRLDAQQSVTIPAADLSNPRIDELYLVVYDTTYDSQGRTLPRLALRKGDAAASPVAPGPDSVWKAYLKLATINVAAGVTTIDPASITRATPVVTVGTSSTRGRTGVIEAWTGAVAPEGSLLCHGQAISRTTYAKLFALIGTTYGTGDGSSTFNIPDLRQRFLLGRAASGTGAVLGETGGSIDHTHTQPTHVHTGPSHTHTFSDTSSSTGAHTHTGPSHSHSAGSYVIGDTDGAHSHSFSDTSSSNSGGAGAAAGSFTTGGSHAHSVSGSTSTAGAHGHGFAGSSGAGGTGSTSSAGAHTHDVSGTSSSSGTGATGSGGGDTTGATNPPFLAINYILWT